MVRKLEEIIQEVLNGRNETSKLDENEDPFVAHNNRKLSEDEISKIQDDKSPATRMFVLRNPSVTEKHITKALKDPDIGVRITAIQHPKATLEHINFALNDEHTFLRKVASDIKKRRFPNS